MDLIRRVQIRRSSFKGELPECPKGCALCHGKGRLHRHGSYERYESPEGERRKKKERFRCVQCRHTFSVLEEMLPYRALQVASLEGHLDGLDPPEVPVKTQDALTRAVGRMVRRAEVLRAAAGLVIKSSTGSSTLWKQLKGACGNLESILLFLGRKINASLLGDYRCLRGWWTIACGHNLIPARQIA